MTVKLIRYSEVSANFTGANGQQARGKDDMSNLGSRAQKSKMMLVDAFDEHYGLGLANLKYHSLNDRSEDEQRFQTLSVLNSSSYENFDVYIKQP